jgi:hypothetical protein
MCLFIYLKASRKLAITEVDLSRAEAGLEAAEALVFFFFFLVVHLEGLPLTK